MNQQSFLNQTNFAVTVCDNDGIIIFMNEKAGKVFEKYGGQALVGSSLLDCHPEPSKTRLKELLRTPRSNAYTIEKNGVKKLIYQTPWSTNGENAGLVELSIELPAEMPHFVRK